MACDVHEPLGISLPASLRRSVRLCGQYLPLSKLDGLHCRARSQVIARSHRVRRGDEIMSVSRPPDHAPILKWTIPPRIPIGAIHLLAFLILLSAQGRMVGIGRWPGLEDRKDEEGE